MDMFSNGRSKFQEHAYPNNEDAPFGDITSRTPTKTIILCSIMDNEQIA